MTLIVGILCSDGVVIGADSAATYSVLGDPTIKQSAEKIKVIEGRGIVASSGPVGLGQRHFRELEKLWPTIKIKRGNPIDEMVKIRNVMLPHTKEEYEMAIIARNLIGPVAIQNALSYTLIAAPINEEARLFQFDQQCSPEMANEDLPFYAIGSGQKTADPFLAFIRSIFFKTKLPSLSEGIMTAIWTLRHSIETTPGGLADPIKIACLRMIDNKLKARMLPKDEYTEHFEFIEQVEKQLQDIRKDLHKEPAKAIPHLEATAKSESADDEPK